jgi:hypothetical protein
MKVGDLVWVHSLNDYFELKPELKPNSRRMMKV